MSAGILFTIRRCRRCRFRCCWPVLGWWVVAISLGIRLLRVVRWCIWAFGDLVVILAGYDQVYLLTL